MPIQICAINIMNFVIGKLMQYRLMSVSQLITMANSEFIY